VQPIEVRKEKMSSKILFTSSIRAGMLISIILFSFSLSVVAFEQWVSYVPSANHVELSYWEEAGISYVNVLIEFPSSGYNVSNWGTLRIEGNTISASAEVWDWTGLDLQVITYVSNDYNLGNLSTGKYLFVFGAWESPVRSISFIVSGGCLEVDLPYLATHMEDFHDVMVKTNGIVKFYPSIYMYEDFWLDAHTGENIPVVVRFAELSIPLENSYIEVQGSIEYCELEGGFFYLNVSSWNSVLPPTTIYIDPGSMTVPYGEEFTVNIEVADVVDLCAWDVWISFDPTVVECIDVVEGPFLKPTAFTYFKIVGINNVTGYAVFGCIGGGSMIPTAPDTVTGSGTLATITFKCLGEGNTDLHLQDTHLTDMIDGNMTLIPHDAVDGFVSQLLLTVYLFPHEIYLDEQTRNFTVSVNIENLKASHRFVGIELWLEYDTAVLTFVKAIEGEFLKDFPKIRPLDTEWYGILLAPPWTRFPEGNGTVVAFSFTVSGLLDSTIDLTKCRFATSDAGVVSLQDDYCRICNIWNRADLNYDGQVNVLDLSVFATVFATHAGHYRWNTNVDLDGNQVINIIDAAMIAKNFGQNATQQ